VDDPRKHLRFGDCGIIAAIDDSEKGKNSIAVYNLDDDRLNRARQAEVAKSLILPQYSTT
jgi:hypothetical protein